MVALHTLVETLASFNARRLFEFSVSLLNVPTHGARLLCVGRGQLSLAFVTTYSVPSVESGRRNKLK